ncbi:hypothetical protein [Microbacterium sp. SORGH_AS_0888]|uniref:hypothetical protein n=1 Tax=Microbacterium sp. SORGH_AS_0888 TaxID=3041791 RepID=UPI00278094EA|nr:hypothetical protein [Microbacterium sp. SORGH_AS_0888]MDQ1130901.1 hypothetical protein [Microbacterium sp. SORGH_AS_0888]
MSNGDLYLKTDGNDDRYTLVKNDVPFDVTDEWLIDDCALVIEATDETMTVWGRE